MAYKIKPGFPCPRCGLPVKSILAKKIGERTYLYAYHGYVEKDPSTGRKKAKLCYLGPEDYYEYVTVTHDFALLSPVYLDREIHYLENLKNRIEKIAPLILKETALNLAKSLAEILNILIEHGKVNREEIVNFLKSK